MLTLPNCSTRHSITALAIAMTLAGTAPVFAGAGKPGHQHGGDHADAETAIGTPGKASDATRTITVTMQDNFYEPEKITVQAGETVRFEIVNKGTFLHEFGLGTAAMHAAHQKAMVVMMELGMIEVDRINHERMKMSAGPKGQAAATHVMPDGTVMQGAKHAGDGGMGHGSGQEHMSAGPKGQAGSSHVMPDGTVMQGAKHAGNGGKGHGSGHEHMSHGPKGQAGSSHVMPDGTVMQGAKHAGNGDKGHGSGHEHMSHGPKGQAGTTHVMPDGTVMQGAKHTGYGGMGHGSDQGDMNHMHGAESGSVLVEPGKSAEIIWTFPKQMKLEFACNIPGHYESGMVGPLTVR